MTAGIAFEQLICASVFSAEASALDDVAFVHEGVRAARVSDVLYVPQLKLHLIGGTRVPLEAIHDPWSLGFEVGRNFQGQADAYRAPFDTAFQDGEVCILANFYSRNFFHWITEEMVKVTVLERSGFTGRYVLCNLPDFAAQFLGLVGIGSDRIILDVPVATRFASVVYTSAITARQLTDYPDLFFALRESVMRNLPATDASPTRRLWMDRCLGVNNKGRELLNPDEVFPVLERHGFEVVDMAAHDVSTQIALASQASALSGPHGAGFIHTLFMRPKSHVIECFSPLFINPGVFEVCRLLRHRYSMIVYENCYEGYPYGDRLMVNCSQLELVLQSLD